MGVFQNYWTTNFAVPHTAELADGTVRLGPIRGFSMGGALRPGQDGPLSNVHSVGECAYNLAADSIVGKPWPSYLAMGGYLSATLAERVDTSPSQNFDPDPGTPVENSVPDTSLLAETRVRLAGLQDDRFSEDRAHDFVTWCRNERERRQDRHHDSDLLILAEAHALSAAARQESRGFFYRADFPQANTALAGHLTRARYNPASDQVQVELVNTAPGPKPT
jgi:L-aspartate oxidase